MGAHSLPGAMNPWGGAAVGCTCLSHLAASGHTLVLQLHRTQLLNDLFQALPKELGGKCVSDQSCAVGLGSVSLRGAKASFNPTLILTLPLGNVCERSA